MKKALHIYGMTLLVLFLLLGLTSCDERNTAPENHLLSAAERGIGEVTMTISVNKKLTPGGTSTDSVKYWEFMATPRFVLPATEGDIVGTVGYWRRLNDITTPDGGELLTTTSLGRYMGGDWLFELRGLNKNGHVVYLGHTVSHIRDGKDNVVAISVYPDSSDGTHGESMDDTSRITGVTDKDVGKSTTVRYGTFQTGFIVTKIDDSLEDMKISVTAQKLYKATDTYRDPVPVPVTWSIRKSGEKLTSWYENATADDYNYTGDGTGTVPYGKVYYETTCQMDAGIYLITYRLSAVNASGQTVELGGQTINVTIIGGEHTNAKGYLTPGSYIVSGIKLAVPGTIYGTINGKGSVVSVSASSVRLEWVQDQTSIESSDEVPISFEWYLENEKLPHTGSSITLNCPADAGGNPVYGVYRVSLRPIGSAGSKGHTDIDVIFNPAEKEDLGTFDWASVRTYTDTLESIYDVDPLINSNMIVIGYTEGMGNPVRWTAGTNLIEYPYNVRVKNLKDVYTPQDVGLRVVYTQSASDIEASGVKALWFGPQATLGETNKARCVNVEEVRFVPNTTNQIVSYTIGQFACSWMTGLKKVEIPNDVKNINRDAFRNCTSLEEINIPALVLNQSVFQDCTSLKRAVMATETDLSTAVSCFSGCTSLWYVKLPAGTNKLIPGDAFKNCRSLKKIEIPSCYTKLDGQSFQESGLEEIVSESIKTIGTGTFRNIKTLQRVHLPNLEEITGCQAFSGDTLLTDVYLGNKLKKLPYQTFYGCTSLGTFDIPEPVKIIEYGTFYNCTSLSSVQISSGITEIEYSAFEKCSSLNTVILPDTLTKIGSKVFYDCTKLNHINIPSSVTLINKQVFQNTGLEEAVFESVTGWKADGTAIPSSDLTDMKRAAQSLKSRYYANVLTKN